MTNASLQRVQAACSGPRARIFLGAVTAWLFPAWAIPLGAFVASLIASSGTGNSIGLEHLLRAMILIPLAGLLIGAPTLIIGYLGWFLLHRAGYRGIGAAALLGLFAPLGSIGAVSLFSFNIFSGDGGAIFLACLILLGAITGLLVRVIAYPRSADPRQP